MKRRPETETVCASALIDHMRETTRKDKALQKEVKVMIFKTTAVALLSSLLIGAASTPARSATVEERRRYASRQGGRNDEDSQEERSSFNFWPAYRQRICAAEDGSGKDPGHSGR